MRQNSSLEINGYMRPLDRKHGLLPHLVSFLHNDDYCNLSLQLSNINQHDQKAHTTDSYVYNDQKLESIPEDDKSEIKYLERISVMGFDCTASFQKKECWWRKRVSGWWKECKSCSAKTSCPSFEPPAVIDCIILKADIVAKNIMGGKIVR